MGKKKEKMMTPAELARRGGNATFKKHGKKHYAKMLKKRWEAYRERKAAEAKKPKSPSTK